MPKPKQGRPSAAEIAEARAAGVPWKRIEAETGYSRGRLWEILTGRVPVRARAEKDVVTTSSGLTPSWGQQVACLACEKGD